MWKLLTVLIVGAIVLFLIAPIVIALPMAVSDQTALGFPAEQFTCKWFEELATHRWREAMASSLLLGLVSAALAVVVGALAAFRVAVWPASRAAKTLSILIIAVLIVPPIWLATGYFRLFGEGGLTVLILPHTLLALPLAFSCIWYGMSRLHPALLDAASLLGASQLSTFIRVYLPGCRGYIIAAFFVAFLASWDESVFSLFLTGPNISTIPKLAFETMRMDRDLTVAAVNLVAGTALAGCLVVLLRRIDYEY